MNHWHRFALEGFKLLLQIAIRPRQRGSKRDGRRRRVRIKSLDRVR